MLNYNRFKIPTGNGGEGFSKERINCASLPASLLGWEMPCDISLTNRYRSFIYFPCSIAPRFRVSQPKFCFLLLFVRLLEVLYSKSISLKIVLLCRNDLKKKGNQGEGSTEQRVPMFTEQTFAKWYIPYFGANKKPLLCIQHSARHAQALEKLIHQGILQGASLHPYF